MNKKKTIVVAEDHTILREGLKSLLSANEKLKVIGEAEDGIEAIRCVESLQPDLLILDLAMPKMSGLSALKDIKNRFPATSVLVLTIHKSEEYIMEAFNSGADGYCLKYATQNELELAIKSVLDGNRYISPQISKQVINGFLKKSNVRKTETAWDRLTQREKEILKLIGEGHRNKNIAEYLCISIKTVDKHRSNLMKKLDIHNSSALTAYAIAKGIVTPT